MAGKQGIVLHETGRETDIHFQEGRSWREEDQATLLEGQIKDVDRKIDVRTAEAKTSLTYTVWLAMGTLGAAMALLRLF